MQIFPSFWDAKDLAHQRVTLSLWSSRCWGWSNRSLETSLSATNSPVANHVPWFLKRSLSLWGCISFNIWDTGIIFTFMFNTALAHWCATTAFDCHISDVRAATASLYSSGPLSEFCMRSSTKPSTCCISFAGNSGSGLASMSPKSVRVFDQVARIYIQRKYLGITQKLREYTK